MFANGWGNQQMGSDMKKAWTTQCLHVLIFIDIAYSQTSVCNSIVWEGMRQLTARSKTSKLPRETGHVYIHQLEQHQHFISCFCLKVLKDLVDHDCKATVYLLWKRVTTRGGIQDWTKTSCYAHHYDRQEGEPGWLWFGQSLLRPWKGACPFGIHCQACTGQERNQEQST